MPYVKEADMYSDVVSWLDQFLSDRFRREKVIVRDTSRQPLKRVFELERIRPASKPEWQTYDIRVDVTGFVCDSENIELAFVECKIQSITLKDISQLLGYSRVALPVYACIVSPAGISSDLSSLLVTYSRHDILQYHWPRKEIPRSIVVASWDTKRKSLDYASIIPKGHPFHAVR
jgi:hypothetical protein